MTELEIQNKNRKQVEIREMCGHVSCNMLYSRTYGSRIRTRTRCARRQGQGLEVQRQGQGLSSRTTALGYSEE